MHHSAEINPYTLMTDKTDSYIFYDGELHRYEYTEYTYSDVNPFKDREMQLYNDVFGGNKHTIKITVGVGTDKESTYSIAANEEAYLDYWILSSDRTYDIYADR